MEQSGIPHYFLWCLWRERNAELLRVVKSLVRISSYFSFTPFLSGSMRRTFILFFSFRFD
jgi:hypothetical protein